MKADMEPAAPSGKEVSCTMFGTGLHGLAVPDHYAALLPQMVAMHGYVRLGLE